MLQRVHLASDTLQQWMHRDSGFVQDDESIECWYPFTCTWMMQPSLVITTLVAVSTPSGQVHANDLTKLEHWAQRVKVSGSNKRVDRQAKARARPNVLIFHTGIYSI